MLVIVLALPSSAFGYPAAAPKGTKLSAGCTGKVSALYPRLSTCTIAGPRKSRIWCPNGSAFDLDEAEPVKALARSLCGLTQIPD
jgi:hypothetical protein